MSFEFPWYFVDLESMYKILNTLTLALSPQGRG